MSYEDDFEDFNETGKINSKKSKSDDIIDDYSMGNFEEKEDSDFF